MKQLTPDLAAGEKVLDLAGGGKQSFVSRATDPLILPQPYASPADLAAQYPTPLDPTEVIAMCEELSVWQALPEETTSLYAYTWRELNELAFTSGSGYISFADGSAPRSISPRVIFQTQGPHTMLSASATVKFDITNYDNQAAHLGGGIRLNQQYTGSISLSAAFLMFGYEAGGFLIGLSHDITLTQLSADKPGRGAFELSLSFTGLYENEEALWPSF